MSPDGSKSPPEERLLKLIRGKAPPPATGPHGPALRAEPPLAAGTGGEVQPVAPARPVGSTGAGGSTAPSMRMPVTVTLGLPGWWLRVVQVVLGAVIMGELVTLVVVLSRPTPTVAAPPVIQTAAPSPTPSTTMQELTAPMPSIAAAVSRPMFLSHTGSAASLSGTTVRPGGSPSADAKALVSRLSLTGIMDMGPGYSAQAIIEDAHTKKTFVVTTGQSLIEGLVVSEIRDNRVMLDLNGEIIELSL